MPYCVLSGMLSKSKGQVLRVAACLHVIFCEIDAIEGESSVEAIPSTISKEAIIAAENFVGTCCQHAAFMAGRGKIEEEMSKLATGILMQQYLNILLQYPLSRLHPP